MTCQQEQTRLWGAYDLSGLVAHSLSGFHGYRGGDHETGGMAAGGPDETIRGSVRRMDGAAAFAGGGGPDSGGFRPHFPTLRRGVRRRGAGCPPRSADLPGIPPPRARGRGPGPDHALSRPAYRLERKAFPHLVPALRGNPQLHLGQDPPPGGPAGKEGATTRRPSQATGEGSLARHDAPPGRQPARMGAGEEMGQHVSEWGPATSPILPTPLFL